MDENNVAVPKQSFFRHWWFWLIIIVGLLGITWAVMAFIVHPKENFAKDEQNRIAVEENDSQGENSSKNENVTGKYPKCPSNLSGILTYQLMDPKYIGSMIPLGNVEPPGHTSPVDHIYFNLNSDDQVPLYAPADGWITHIMANSTKATATSNYEFDSFVVTYTICDGLVLDFAGYTDVVQSITDELNKQQDACKSGITKVGHDAAAEQQCDYRDLNIKVTSGELIGHTHREKREGGGYTIPFEIWSANYNQPSPSNFDWSFYDDNRYAHNICTFDLYSGDLKNQFDAKFGDYQINTVKNKNGTVTTSDPLFVPRTVAPICGTLYQDSVGTIQGMWFSSKPQDTGGSVRGTGQGISFLHNNIDPTKGEVVVGGEMNNDLVGFFAYNPTHTGTINREPSEIKADGKVYCYQQDTSVGNISNSISDKILVQLVDDHHIKAENQNGTCSSSEAFKTPYNFER